MGVGELDVTEGKEEEFIARWREWLEWSSRNIPGFVAATLIRDAQDPRHFVSFSPWNDAEAREVWKASDGFRDGFANARALCDDFQGGDFELAVAVSPADSALG